MFGLNVLVALTYLAHAYANPTPHEKRDAAPFGFVKTGVPSPETVLDLRVALAQTNIAGLHQALMDVSTPSSANYKKYLSKEEVEAFVTPTSETIAAANKFFSSNDIQTTVKSPAGDWLGFSLPVNQANSLFNANFSIFTHQDTGRQTIRTLSYSIPDSLQGHVDLVHPTTSFPNPSDSQPSVLISPAGSNNATIAKSNSIPTSCSPLITPGCLQNLYGIPATPATQAANKLYVTGFTEEYAGESDLESFLTSTRPDISPNTTFGLLTLDGGSNLQGPGQAGLEANLDIQYTVGLATGVPVSFLTVGGALYDGFLDIPNYLLGQSEVPTVLSTSYYFYNELTIDPSVANNLCNMYAQLGARGTSVLFCSGDGGVAGGPNPSNSCSNFIATFPSTCPFVTSLGATLGVNPEVAASFTSGGFSNYFSIPAYQENAVRDYIEGLGSTYSGLFNASGRGFPDVSAQGENVEIILNGDVTSVYGTSASTPIFASVISLLNDELISVGESPLGFLNPFLYSTAAWAFTDITSGSNPGCNTNGFPVTAGWDPVTGLGTPNFEKLREAAGLW